MVEILPEETKEDKHELQNTTVSTTDATIKNKKRKTVVWSVNIFTVVIYMMDP